MKWNESAVHDFLLLQLDAFRALKSCERDQCEESCECLLSDNFRPVQPLNGRAVAASFRKHCNCILIRPLKRLEKYVGPVPTAYAAVRLCNFNHKTDLKLSFWHSKLKIGTAVGHRGRAYLQTRRTFLQFWVLCAVWISYRKHARETDVQTDP